MKEQEVAALLRDASLRATPQRIRIIMLLASRKCPVTVGEIVTLGKGAFDTATVYRSLESLIECGLVRRIGIDRERAFYEIAGDHHHHAVCVSCGTIRDVSACVSPTLDAKAKSAAGFARIDRHSLEFFGVCEACV